jgi:hypothetical protein
MRRGSGRETGTQLPCAPDVGIGAGESPGQSGKGRTSDGQIGKHYRGGWFAGRGGYPAMGAGMHQSALVIVEECERYGYMAYSQRRSMIIRSLFGMILPS